MKRKWSTRIAVVSFILMISVIMTSAVYAVNVPAGVKLAKKQEYTETRAEPTSLDPHKMDAEPSFHQGKELYDGLVSQDEVGNIIPAIAAKWEAKDNNQTFIFHLRKEAKFSNGKKITANDFVYSFRRLLMPEIASPYGWFAEMPMIVNSGAILKGDKKPETLGVRAIDDHTLEVKLESPVPYFVRLMSHPVFFVIDQECVEKFGDKWTQPQNIVCSGPFKLKEWVVNEKIVMVKNENYWNADEVVLQKITSLAIMDPNIVLKRYLAGEVDHVWDIPAEQLPRIRKQLSNEMIKVAPFLRSTYYWFKMDEGITKDINVRKALTYAIDRDIFTKHVTGGGELPMYGLVPPNILGFDPEEPAMAKMTQAEREDKAVEFLKKAGYSKKKPLKFEVTIPTFARDKKEALALVGMWKKVLGAKCTLKALEGKVFYGIKSGFTVMRGGWVADYNEASTYLDIFTTTGYNKSKYNNPEYDKLMKDAKSMADPTANYLKAEAILQRDLPFVPIYRPGNKEVLLKPYVGGYKFTNPKENYYKRYIYIIAH